MSTVNPVGNGLTGASGTGNFAGNVSPSFTTPSLGTPSAGVLSSCTAYAQSALTGLGTGISTALGINVGTAGSPVVNGGALGTPSSGTLSSCTGYAQSALTGLGTSVSTALGVNVGTAGSPVVNGGALGTPSSGTLTSCTGLPIAGTTGYGTGVATALAANINGVSGFPTVIADTTWTPVFTSAGGGTATYSIQTGLYTQIGSLVFFTLEVALSALPSSGNVTITGLPIATGSGTKYYAFSIYSSSLQATVTSPLTALAVPSSTAISLYSFATGTMTQLTVSQCTTASVFIISGYYHT